MQHALLTILGYLVLKSEGVYPYSSDPDTRTPHSRRRTRIRPLRVCHFPPYIYTRARALLIYHANAGELAWILSSRAGRDVRYLVLSPERLSSGDSGPPNESISGLSFGHGSKRVKQAISNTSTRHQRRLQRHIRCICAKEPRIEGVKKAYFRGAFPVRPA